MLSHPANYVIILSNLLIWQNITDEHLNSNDAHVNSKENSKTSLTGMVFGDGLKISAEITADKLANSNDEMIV